MQNKISDKAEILEAIDAVHKTVADVNAHVGEVLEAVGHFSNETEMRFRGIEGTLHGVSSIAEIAKDQKKILGLLEKDAKRSQRHDAEFAANTSAHGRFEKRLKKLERKQPA